jgi:hypothetical protein
MKKILSILFVTGMLSILACGGPSEADKKKMEENAKAKMDSIFNAANQNMNAAGSDSSGTAKDSLPK